MTEISKTELAKQIMAKDLECFGKYLFGHHLKLETPDFHKEVYRKFEDKGLNRIAIAAPRGHAKSTITDLVYLAWEIIYKRVNFVLLVSDTYSQSVLFLEALKAEFEANEKLRGLFGDLTSKNWSEGEIIVNGIMVKAIGAGMKVRGLKYRENRPDLIIVDDLENDELVENKDRRDKLERWFNGALVPSMSKNGRIIVIGTVLHYDSLLFKLISPGTYEEYDKSIYRAITDNQALWPEHLNLKEIDEIKQQYIASGQIYLFYQEYQNDPVSGENRKFKWEKIKYYTDEEIKYKELAKFITIDRAYSKEKTADSTGIIVNGVDKDNNWFVLHAERFKGTEKEIIDKIFDLKRFYQPIKIGIEQKAFEYTIKPALTDRMRLENEFFIVEELKDLGKSKNIRIEGLLPRFELGTIYFKREQTDLIDELIKFPMGLHDDLADSLAYQLSMANTSTNKVKVIDSNITYKR